MITQSEDPSALDDLPELNTGHVNAVKWEDVDGNTVFFPCPVGKCYPTEDQKLLAEILCQDLNEQLRLGGAWRVVWSQPAKVSWDQLTKIHRAYMPKKLECQYMDNEGDVQFVVAFEQSMRTLLNWGYDNLLSNCDAAYNEWASIMQIVDVRESQKYRPLCGERPTDEVAQFTPM